MHLQGSRGEGGGFSRRNDYFRPRRLPRYEKRVQSMGLLAKRYLDVRLHIKTRECVTRRSGQARPLGYLAIYDVQ